ncbi:FAD-dependent oxidoreductase [Flavobacteriaceae bacterium F89]|uniref:FAD-dependent oxidoreductase n=1 Tax=Cerina litoralis TaxID=2874477 RepID=A0AAE3ETV2_9FLAO|nr:FAD-dependent oxidoreductase [Cerina litoralis]MCG2459502.1 FAD-dependent oxidoreductase [Cerina litoralis]
MGKNIIVIGGGIIGMSTAYYLHQEGHRVTIIDKSNMDHGASYVNAGYLTPSHIIPMASPGMMLKGIKWMFNSSSPFYIKPRFDLDFIKWAWQFNAASTKARVEKAIPLIKDINLLSKELYTEIYESGNLGDFQLVKKGLLMLYKTEKEGQHEMEVANRAKDEGLDVRELSLRELHSLQPNLSSEILGAVHYECDAHTTPEEIMQNLKKYLTDHGVTLKTGEEVVDFNFSGSIIDKVITQKDSYKFDEMVLASGSWSQHLAKKLQLKIAVQPGKGYRIDVKRPTGIVVPAILMEAKVAVTPMKGFTRFAGTMELSGINDTINKTRVQAIAKAASAYYKGLQITDKEQTEAQCGLRPVSPDGLPYIGRTSKWANLTVATGHAMMGWSLGPATGKLVSEIISGKKLSMNIEGLAPERKL